VIGANGSRGRYWDEGLETLEAGPLRQMQLERLRSQVERSYFSSDFYRERLDAAGVAPSDIKTLEDVRRIPVVTKDELRIEQTAHPPFGRLVVAPRITWRELHPSTGTTGRPVNTIWTKNDVRVIRAVTARTLWQFGTRPTDVVHNAFAYGLWVAGLAAHYGADLIGALCIPAGAALATQKQVEFFTESRSTVLLATPSFGMHIAEVLRSGGIDPASLDLRLGCFGGEAGTEVEATRLKLERGLGIDAFDYYGLAEVGPTFASECEAKVGIHFAEDFVLVECIDPETMEPVADGEIGVLVLTHLDREAMPMLRYWTNDYARLDHSRCECGRTHVRAPGGILGRHDDLVIYKGAKFYPVQVEKVVRANSNLSDEFRIRLVRAAGSSQVTRCTVVAELATAGEADSEIARLRRDLRAELGVTPEIDLVSFGTLERTTFKAKRIEWMAQPGD
jgi:phenylacetate-CoA ligase